MQINAHFSMGIILAFLIKIWFLPNLSFFEIAFVIFVSVIIDFDFLFSSFLSDHNHRRLPTHGILLYFILLIIGIGFFYFHVNYPLLFALAGLFHVGLDLIDWGTALLSPIRTHLLVGGILPPPPSNDGTETPQCYFTMVYYGSRTMIILEIAIFLLSVILILLIDFIYLYLLIGYFVILILYLFHYHSCRMKKAKN